MVRLGLRGGKRRGSVRAVRILIIVVVALFLFLWVGAVIDVFRRDDLSVLSKLLWTIGMLAFPFIGLGVYTLARAARA
jgi:Phospholipase_D-nuclease N-terminal